MSRRQISLMFAPVLLSFQLLQVCTAQELQELTHKTMADLLNPKPSQSRGIDEDKAGALAEAAAFRRQQCGDFSQLAAKEHQSIKRVCYDYQDILLRLPSIDYYNSWCLQNRNNEQMSSILDKWRDIINACRGCLQQQVKSTGKPGPTCPPATSAARSLRRRLGVP
jgi:hypothetical protein